LSGWDYREKQIRQIGVELMKQGLEIRPAFWPLSDLPVFKPYAYGTQHNAIKLLKSMIVLPSSIKLAENNGKAIEEIVEIVKSAIAKF